MKIRTHRQRHTHHAGLDYVMRDGTPLWQGDISPIRPVHYGHRPRAEAEQPPMTVHERKRAYAWVEWWPLPLEFS